MTEAERERARQRARDWHADPANKARTKAYYAARRADPTIGARMRATDAAASQRWKEANPDRSRAVQLRWRYRRRYGMSEVDTERAIARVLAGGSCDACGTAPATDVDHCHTAKVFRGYLCHGCNTAAGYLADDPARAEALAQYLRS
jgi:hypothetical protein